MAEQSEKDQRGFIERYSDPSDLTTKQILREVAWLEKFFAAKIEAIEEGIKVAHDDLVRVPTDVQIKVSDLKELLEAKINELKNLYDERFKNFDKGLKLVEESRVEQKMDTNEKVATALKAAKELVGEQNTSNNLSITKSEGATAKQIDQMNLRMNTIENAVTDKFNDMKDRVTRIEGNTASIGSMKEQIAALGSGASEGKGKSAGYAQFLGWVAFGIMFVGFIILLINTFKK